MGQTHEASFEYLQWDELYEVEKPYEIFLDDATLLQNGVKRTNLSFKKSPVQQAHDTRGREQSFSLDTHGFAWVKNCIDVNDLRSEDGILGSYIPAMERMLEREVEGADRVVIFDWRTRLSTSKEEFERKAVDLNNGLDPLQPVVYPHVDQTPEGAIARAYHHLGAEAEDLLRGRFRIMNVWRPLAVVEDWPLAVCDGRSVQPEDLVASDYVRRNYQGESFFAMYNESHKWHFMSKQSPEDALLFKVYDSSDDVQAKYCLHASFPMLDDIEAKRPRESIECRALVFTHPEAEWQVENCTADIQPQPMIYGTAGKKSETTKSAVTAINAGFRAFDTAAQPQKYDEALLGEALRRVISQGIVQRDELWIQTKFSNLESRDTIHMPYDPTAPIADQIRCSVMSSLANLGIGDQTYLDCLILHAPLATMDETMEAWDALSAFVPAKVRYLGISNTAVTTLSILYNKARIKPSVVQNRFCKRTLYDTQVRQFCRNRGISYQGFGLLNDSSSLQQSAFVRRLADEVGISIEQALFALAKAIEIVPLNGTTSEEHMIGDLAALESVRLWREAAVNKAAWEEIMHEFEAAIA